MITPTGGADFKPKPVYNALVHSLKTLPLDANVLKPTWYEHDDPITLSALHHESTRKLHIVAANSTEVTQTKKIPITSQLKGLTLAEISTMIDSGASDSSTVSITDTEIIIQMPPLSIARINLSLGN